ncbi:MAG: acyl-CoA dehydrogenase family protein [Clostridia bacterium]|nr:acyl-CoA dehydrogenase family protein [Clostridia bacterium]
MADEDIIKGGSFLLEMPDPQKVFTPEDFTDEHKMMAKTTMDFTLEKVWPYRDQINEKDYDLLKRLIREAGELGLLGADVPEEYGGSGLDKISSMVITEYLVYGGGSYSVTFGAHTGIGSLPIVYFGNKEQKQRFLPDLAEGKKIAAYALTEPGAGSDAMNIKTKATLSADGKYYILNGTKQFITNAAIADVFIVFAKVDGEKFTAFIVEKGTEGFSIGAEEHKMGIKGSSTCSLIFEDAKVPVENVLFEVGRGYRVAFNILDIGRQKLAVGCVGSCKLVIELAVKYALERVQFGVPIAQFGLIREKIADMAIKTYAAESAVYRASGLIDAKLHTVDVTAEDAGQQSLKAIEDYAIECSINKVLGSETLDYVADEGVQIFGGYGYTYEYPVEEAYRDARINRIFEGTNEVNRLLIPGTMVRKAMKGELDLMGAIGRLGEDIRAALAAEPDGSVLGEEKVATDRVKKVLLMVAGNAVQKFGTALEKEQEILRLLGDIGIELFAMESALLRTLKAIQRDGEEAASLKIAYTKAYVHDALPRIATLAKNGMAAIEADAETLAKRIATIERLTAHSPINVIGIKRQIAEKVIEAGKYVV